MFFFSGALFIVSNRLPLLVAVTKVRSQLKFGFNLGKLLYVSDLIIFVQGEIIV